MTHSCVRDVTNFIARAVWLSRRAAMCLTYMCTTHSDLRLGSCVCAVPFILLTRGHIIHTHKNIICICCEYVCLCVCVCVFACLFNMESHTHTHQFTQAHTHTHACTNTCKNIYLKPIPKDLRTVRIYAYGVRVWVRVSPWMFVCGCGCPNRHPCDRGFERSRDGKCQRLPLCSTGNLWSCSYFVRALW